MTGAIYDRGYRPYEGELGGRNSTRAALIRATIRRALGIRRSWRQKVMPFALLAITVVPAVVNVGVKYLTRDTPAQDIDFITYRDYVGVSSALIVFVALTSPDVICPDRRQRVLSLLFARPLTGTDYVLAKVGAMFSILFAFSFLPQVVLFVGQTLVASEGVLDYVRANAEVVWQVPVAVAFLALYYAVVSLAVASLTSRRTVAGASIAGLFLISSIVANTLADAQSTAVGLVQVADPTPAPLLNLLALPLLIRDLVFLGHIDDSDMAGLSGGGAFAIGAYVAVVGVGIVVLLRRYREAVQ